MLLMLAGTLALAQGISGSYSGKWTGASGTDGDFHLTVAPDGSGGVRAEVMFTIGGQEVKCKVTRSKIEGEKIVELAYEFTLGDVKLESAIAGAKKGTSLAGTYRTKTVADGSLVDEGTWQASPK